MISTGIVAQPVAAPKCPECGADLTMQASPLSTVKCPSCQKDVMMPGCLGQYHLIRLIGAGGMGAVYEGVDTGLQRKIAVKVILREKAEEDPSFIDSFKREAQSAARLNSSNIVGVYAFGDSEGQPYLVMELVQPDAFDRMMKNGPVNPVTAMSVGRQIAQGLKVAAEHGLVHGDVKPENILINEAREAKLADFGIAALEGAKAAANNEVWGTPYYIAPETLRRQKVDLRADIYSLGATLYHAIAGVPPFEGETAVDVMKARLMGPARSLAEVAPGCPEGIVKIVMRMLEAEPIRRYPNYESLVADITKEIGTGKPAGKRVMVKGKTTSTTAQFKPSQPMQSVTTVNRPLFEKEKEKGKGLLIGIFAGVGAAILVVIGLIIFLVVKATSKVETVIETAVVDAQATVEAAEQATRASQSKADGEALEALGKKLETAYVAQQEGVKEATKLIELMVKRAERAVLPEHKEWLSAKEGEAPTEMLKTVQQFFQDGDSLAKAVAATEAVRAQLDDWRTNAANPSEVIEQARAAIATYEALPEVTTFAKCLKNIQDVNKNWKKTVERARAEMENAIAKQRENERLAKIAERERLQAEQERRAIEEEVASVETIQVACAGDLDKFMPESAMATFKTRQARLKSAEAKAAAEVVGERIGYFQKLKSLWMSDIEKGTFNAIGVTAATDKTVTVNKKSMTWQQFSSSQQKVAFRMIYSQILDDVSARSLRTSDRAELAIGAYLYLETYFGMANIEKSKSLREAMEKLVALASGLPGTKAAFERVCHPASEKSEE